MIKHGKYFLPPPRDDINFKELFKQLVGAGAGRPVDENGFPSGPWTPELLAVAISQIDANRRGIDLRTVQLWFQDNEKGVSTNNIRWLARVFGCDDPEATSEWQMVLGAAQSRLTAKRRARRSTNNSNAMESLNLAGIATSGSEATSLTKTAPDDDATEPRQGSSLARRSEAIFGGSPLDLPSSVFAGAVALGFSSYFLGIHNVTYGTLDGPIKQVGFLWAPNWTLLFMVFMPLFFVFVVDLVAFWKNEGRSKLLAKGDRMESDDGWTRKVEGSSYTYWAVFLICLGVAGLLQWIGVRLIPLMGGGGDYAIDWGSLAILRPDVISVPQSVAFTGFAYLYMCLCFYLFFVGLILLYTLAHDLWEIVSQTHVDSHREANEIGLRVMRGIFRCTILGVLIAICMKLQSFFVTSSGANIVGWLVGDMFSVLNAGDAVSDGTDHSRPTHYSSLLIALMTCVVFLYGSVRIGFGSRFHVPWAKMGAVVALLAVSYLLIGAFAGFSILLSVGVLVAIYALFDPALGQKRASKLGDKQVVL